jgi:hypothetical protein
MLMRVTNVLSDDGDFAADSLLVFAGGYEVKVVPRGYFLSGVIGQIPGGGPAR